MSKHAIPHRAPALFAAAAVLLALASAGCKKEGSTDWDDVSSRPDAVEKHRKQASGWTAPPMFSSIPADTPYVFAMFEPIPEAYWDKVFGELGGKMAESFAEMEELLAALPEDPESRLIVAIFREIADNMTEDGFARLGIASNPRFAFYGLGLQPVVRIELADAGKLAAAVGRIEAGAGASLPRRSAGSAKYWFGTEGDVAFAVGTVGDELVATFGDAADTEEAAQQLFGGAKPAASLADTTTLNELGTEHGFAPYGLGYVDLSRLTEILVREEIESGADLSGPCAEALKDATGPVERLVFGYDHIGSDRASLSAVLEVAPELAKELRGLRASVPGLSSKLPGKPLIALGGAVNLDRARELLMAAAAGMERLAAPCEDEQLAEAAAKLRAGSAELEAPAGLRGGMVVLQDVDMGGGMPSNPQGYAVIAADDPMELLGPLMGSTSVPSDGSFESVSVPMIGKVDVAIRDDAMLLAMGGKAKKQLKEAVKAAGEDAPLMLMSYDAGRFAGEMRKMTGVAPGMSGTSSLFAAEEQFFGQAVMTVYVTDKGLAMSARLDFK